MIQAGQIGIQAAWDDTQARRDAQKFAADMRALFDQVSRDARRAAGGVGAAPAGISPADRGVSGGTLPIVRPEAVQDSRQRGVSSGRELALYEPFAQEHYGPRSAPGGNLPVPWAGPQAGGGGGGQWNWQQQQYRQYNQATQTWQEATFQQATFQQLNNQNVFNIRNAAARTPRPPRPPRSQGFEKLLGTLFATMSVAQVTAQGLEQWSQRESASLYGGIEAQLSVNAGLANQSWDSLIFRRMGLPNDIDRIEVARASNRFQRQSDELRALARTTRQAGRLIGLGGFSRERQAIEDERINTEAEVAQRRIAAYSMARFDPQGAALMLRELDGVEKAEAFRRAKSRDDIERRVATERRDIIASARASALRLDSQPYWAAQAELTHRQQEERREFERSHATDPALRERLVEKDREHHLQRSELAREHAIEKININIGLGGNRAALNALLARDPTSAALIQSVAATRIDELRLRTRGFAEEADERRSQGQAEIQLLRQNYLNAFRGEQFDLRNRGIDNARDVENPTRVIANMFAAENSLNKKTDVNTVDLSDDSINKQARAFREALTDLIRN